MATRNALIPQPLLPILGEGEQEWDYKAPESKAPLPSLEEGLG
jgi:hypothetical protein